MIKLSVLDEYSYNDVLELCKDGITGNTYLRNIFILQHSYLLPYETQYETLAQASQLYTLQSIDVSNSSDPKVVGDLKKSDLEKLYTQYFAGDGKPARTVYNAIKNAAKESCPFCGGIGTPKNVDHFLPKAHFPQYAILPQNLVPACRDCNMESKGHEFATSAEEQIIHPYFDAAHFFYEQWIYAVYKKGNNETDPGHFEYFADPPQHWPMTDKKRAHKYFTDFDLSARYTTQAAKQLRVVRAQINRNLQKHIPAIEIIEDLLEPVLEECSSINHWQYGMYSALILHLKSLQYIEI